MQSSLKGSAQQKQMQRNSLFKIFRNELGQTVLVDTLDVESLPFQGPRRLQKISESQMESGPLTPMLLKSIAIHLPFLSRYFCCKSMPSPWQKVAYTASICITIRPSVCIAMLLQKYYCATGDFGITVIILFWNSFPALHYIVFTAKTSGSIYFALH